MNISELLTTARALVADGKGLLAADESQPTIAKRFDTIKLANTETARRDYREMLFTGHGIGQYISGVILFDETLRQRDSQNVLFTEVLKSQGVIPGIKVDASAMDLTNFPGEKITAGLDGLKERLHEYYKLGARFAKWRAVINIGKDLPTMTCLKANAEALARYAALCQAANIVPIVEPEVIMDGDHSIERCYDVTDWTLQQVFTALKAHRVALEGLLLKPNMVVSGKAHVAQADVQTVAEMTVKVCLKNVPAAVPGVVFLSGGQTEEQATAHLNAMNLRYPQLPWKLSFSFARALQTSALKAWDGKPEQKGAGRKAFMHRARLNSAAAQGKYSEAMEKEG